MDELEQLVDRQYHFLERQTGRALVRRAKQFTQFLVDEPRLQAMASDLVREADQAVQTLEAYDASLLNELIGYRQELAEQAPAFDDSHMPRPDPGVGSSYDYESSFAFFDAYVQGTDQPDGIPLVVTPNDDRTRFSKLLWIVKAKAHSLVQGYDPETQTHSADKERADLRPLLRKLNTLEAKHNHAYRAFLDVRANHAGFAYSALQLIWSELNPTPMDFEELSHAELQHRLARTLHGSGQTLNKAFYGTTDLGSDERAQFDRIVAFIREQCELLYEEVMLRLGMQRSHQGLINRYKYRCEWHEQAQLRQLVEATSTPEDDLARHLALWLFDQGLNPMTKMRAGNLEPDLLDPMSRINLYVEAKQYKDAHGAKAYLVKGIGQMVDTMARLEGTPYGVHEGYYVIYRRAGPRYLFPTMLKYGSFTIYPVVIDIAAANQSGSRQKHKPVIIGEDELTDSKIGL